MFHKSYAFRAYEQLATELLEAAGAVNSDQLALTLLEAAQSVAKLVALVRSKEAFISARARNHYAALRHFARALVVSGGHTECGYHLLRHTGGCTDDDPRNARLDCPRCLCLALGRDDRPLPPFPTADNVSITPPKPRIARQRRTLRDRSVSSPAPVPA